MIKIETLKIILEKNISNIEEIYNHKKLLGDKNSELYYKGKIDALNELLCDLS